MKYAMAIDLDRCMGCRSCMIACKVENGTGKGQHWMYVFRTEEGEYPNVSMTFMPRPCQHCDNAPCVKVCPVGARFKRKDGITLTDYDRCIGCRYCEVACPYGVNSFNWKAPSKNGYLESDAPNYSLVKGEYGSKAWRPFSNPDHDKEYGGRKVSGSGHTKGVMEKCTWCVHRLDKGLDPACVANCPARVFTFGDLDDPTSAISKVLETNTSSRLLEEVGTHPRVFYLNRPLPSEDARQVEAVPMEVDA